MQRSGGGAGGKLLGSSSVFFVGLKSLFWGFLFVSFGGPYFECAYCCWASFLVIILCWYEFSFLSNFFFPVPIALR